MEINLYFRTYNAFGGHPTLTLIGDYLACDAPSFGDALDEVDLNLHFRSDDPPRETLESSYELFHKRADELPRVTFRRKKRKADVSYCSELLTAREAIESRQLALDVFRDGCQEAVTNLKLLRKRIRRDDAFDFAAFQSWLDQRIDQLPSAFEELKFIESEIIERRRIAYESMSEWDKTGLDFDDFHPDARTVLDDPQLWNCSNEWSPNGNDTGADTLELYRQWRKRNRRTGAEVFFHQLMHDWQVPVPPAPADDYATYTYRRAIVGLAFAQIKLDATCDPSIASLALEAIAQEPPNELTPKVRSVLERYA